jgi:hypothetical protein
MFWKRVMVVTNLGLIESHRRRGRPLGLGSTIGECNYSSFSTLRLGHTSTKTRSNGNSLSCPHFSRIAAAVDVLIHSPDTKSESGEPLRMSQHTILLGIPRSTTFTVSLSEYE